jgi:hypothetical protein
VVCIINAQSILQNSLNFYPQRKDSCQMRFFWGGNSTLNCVVSCEEIMYIRNRIDCSYLNERLKFIMNKYTSQTYIKFGQKSKIRVFRVWERII